MKDGEDSRSEEAGPPLPAPAQSILVVDDDAALRTILGLTLKGFGHIVLVAGSGEEALQVAGHHPEIRVILLDVVMAGLSGKELAAQLKTSLPKASILFCSGHPISSLIRHDIDVSSRNFLQKPCRPPDLQPKIEELLDGS
ncbi:MAG: two-component system, cell cycle sensor histidine kinase and response regulator CckA [Verrucomicrobiota bacterium]